MSKKIFSLLTVLFCVFVVRAQIVTGSPNSFSISNASIIVEKSNPELVMIAAGLLQKDIEAVTGKKIPLLNSIENVKGNVIIIGTISHSDLLKQLNKKKKIVTDKLTNTWEASYVKSITSPYKNIDHALIITGSDRRGVAYGVFELSKQIGVSPWYWWADVPVIKKSDLFIDLKTDIIDAPKIKYRGIFLNDEAPALTGWAREKFGGLNHQFYEKVFELILRLKGNYLWPAMWGNAFNDDDTLNPVLADKYGIVMGTSHHEPMLRAQQEWKRYGKGKWDYNVNEEVLKDFWKKGIENMGTHESILTVGMRGDGDMPMSRETATDLLERIVKDQREIITEVTGKPADKTPQLWALYKEVQDYYDKGMRVPDDVTLLLCD
ncbi:MAG TPA: glycosyl hydrolase 115 family protein, partial [Chitinophagaceae bacterium]|nr:glycosyl hydrolase 115 family protein [Chitinophagaceae bacterium]